MSDFVKKIQDTHRAGKINSYMANKLLKASKFGMTDQLLENAIIDAEQASSLNISDDRAYNTRFFILNFADDILNDTFGMAIGSEEKSDLCKYALKSNKVFNNLTDYRMLIYNWLNEHPPKTAHPNISGKFDREQEYDTFKWTQAARAAYELIQQKQMSRDAAIATITNDWDEDEQFKFDNWLKYYESGNAEKYQVKTANIKEAFNLTLPETLLDPKNRSNRLPDVLERLREQQSEKQSRREQQLEEAKKYKAQMKSRLRALKKLLDRYNDVMPQSNIDGIQNEMFALDKSLSKLEILASIQDRVVLSANRFKKMGFDDGADLLIKVAQEPPAAPGDSPSAPGKEVLEALPPPLTSPHPDVPTPKTSDIVNIQTIINRLEGISKKLKSRDTIRELASVDILLNELGMASYFPELTDAQSKLIEAFGYASNKIESIVAKLRGTGSTGTAPAPKAPTQPKKQPMSAEELRGKPVGEVKKQLPTG